MTETFTANFGLNDFDAALFADDATVLHALVLAAITLVILHWTENLGAEQSVALRLEGTVVDGFRLFYFAEGPLTNLLRRSQRNPDSREAQWIFGFVEKVKKVFHFIAPWGLQRILKSRSSSPFKSFVLVFDELDVERQALKFLHKNVERLREARLEQLLALDDRFVHAISTSDVI